MIQKFFYLFVFLIITNVYSQNDAELQVIQQGKGEYAFFVQHDFHLRYGLGFPLTFRFDIPSEIDGLIAMKRYSYSSPWEIIPQKYKYNIFNDVEAVRIDSNNSTAYVSAAFSSGSDSLFIKICDSTGSITETIYTGIPKYYDNRKTAVTITADDWLEGYHDLFPPLLNLFRSHGLYVTVGIVTQYVAPAQWNGIQAEIDKGNVEIASHSRTHPFIPYSNPYGEIIGSVTDIKRNLTLSKYYNLNNSEYVYVWIAPSGEYDSIVDSLLGFGSYLAPRLYVNLPADTPRAYIYGDSAFSSWSNSRNHFEAFLPTVEIGAPSWGGGNTDLVSLNSLFDTIAAKVGIYHLMCHPHTIYEDQNEPYLLDHLSYISFHPDVWYVNLGLLYLYHLIQDANKYPLSSITEKTSQETPKLFILDQNFPNPFNPNTSIRYELTDDTFVNISVYNILGEKVADLVNGLMKKGIHEVNFKSSLLTSGPYIYQLTAGNEVLAKKMILLK